MRIGLLLFCFCSAAAASQSKPIMVHYMPWFVAKPYSSSWGWHWTMNHFNPDIVGTNGQRQIASWYYPMIGPYDSLDPVVLEYQVLLMKLGGIDVVIVDWYGQDNYYDYAINNARTAALLKYTQKAGLKFSLCYEDSTIGAEIAGGSMNGITVTSNNAVAHAQQTILYAQTNYFTNVTYHRFNGQPLLLNFGPQFFGQSTQWTAIFSVLAASNQPAFFTEDNRLAAGLGAFDWPPMYLSQPSGGSNVLSDAALRNYLSNFNNKATGWPAYISSAFPRFHDIYAQAGVGTSFGYLADSNGVTFQGTLTQAGTNASSVIQIVTWNDYGEGTVVEPTQEYGYRDLGMIQDFRRQYFDSTFPYHTNDLTFAARLYNLRRLYSTNSIISAELNRVFSNVVSGNLTVAGQQLTGIESSRPVVYNLSSGGGQLQFAIGGYLSNAGVQVQTTSNVVLGNWQTVSNFPASTNPPQFETLIAPENISTFFRASNPGP